MAITTERAWRADGAPWHPARPIHDLSVLMQGYGYLVGIIGNEAHLSAPVPEDHTPYSHTPWPGPQPYPAVLAEDIEAAPDGYPTTAQIGGQIYADKMAGVHGTEWIKYINWTDPHGDTWHDQWEPTHQRSSSVDKGHTHISGRTDFVNSSIVTASGYDPVARYLEAHMAGVVVDMIGSKSTPSNISLNNFIETMWKRVPADLAATYTEILTAAHNDSETDANISDEAINEIVVKLLAATPPPTGGGGLSVEDVAAVAEAVYVRLRDQYNKP
jgi:hypothetical protein